MAKRGAVVRCPSCGVDNAKGVSRCPSCGATIDELKPIHSTARDRERRYQQEGFSLMWGAVSILVQAVLTGAVIFALPRAIALFDFEGYYGMTLTIPVWCLGGLLVGLISPGKTFVEPVVAAILVAIPTVLYLYSNQTVRTMPWFMYVLMAAAAVMFTLVGAYLGERIQMGPPPKPVD